MTSREAEEAMKNKTLVMIGPAHALDVPGQRVLVATGRLVSKERRRGETVYSLETNFRERMEGTLPMFHPFPTVR